MLSKQETNMIMAYHVQNTIKNFNLENYFPCVQKTLLCLQVMTHLEWHDEHLQQQLKQPVKLSKGRQKRITKTITRHKDVTQPNDAKVVNFEWVDVCQTSTWNTSGFKQLVFLQRDTKESHVENSRTTWHRKRKIYDSAPNRCLQKHHQNYSHYKRSSRSSWRKPKRVLGPVLYLLFTSDIRQPKEVTVPTYADDIALMLTDTNRVSASGAIYNWIISRGKLNLTKLNQPMLTLPSKITTVININKIDVPYANTAQFLWYDFSH